MCDCKIIYFSTKSFFAVDFSAACAEFGCLGLHALAQRVGVADTMLLRVIAHILCDLHRAEVRTAHRTEMRELVRVFRQGFVVKFLRLLRIETEIELILPTEFETRFRQRV